MKSIKKLDNNKLRITEELSDGSKKRIKLKGFIIGEIPNEYTSWFNYKGLTYIVF
ncbi:MAG: hypothetical protein GY932_12040 [Arcobacter sp.]|nr:hypothetical protein [Arcobacter sp.]